MPETTDPQFEEPSITLLLQRHRAGDAEALHELLPFVYGELKRLARHWLTAQHPTWQPTALANELFLSLFAGEPPPWNNRQHFFSTASLRLRRLLIDEARRKQTEKRGGDVIRLPLDEAVDNARPSQKELLALNDALEALAREHTRPAKIVELRFFMGLSLEETALALGLHERTVRRDWEFAKRWLQNYLQA